MSDEINVYRKLANARGHIKETKLKKAGKNTFSKYEYFTPEQIDALVFEACTEHGLITLFNLVNGEYELEGSLTVINMDNPEDRIVFRQATGVPAIKATNLAQQMGGMMTYSERYLAMSAFNIKDNSLDFDTTENTKKAATKPEQKKLVEIKADKVDGLVKWAKLEGHDLAYIKLNYKLSTEIEKQITNKLKE